MIECWVTFPREVVESSPSEMFRSPLDTVLGTLLQLTLLTWEWDGMVYRGLFPLHLFWVILWFSVLPWAWNFLWIWISLLLKSFQGWEGWDACVEGKLWKGANMYWCEDICIHPQRNFSNFFFWISKTGFFNERSLSRQKVGKRSKGWVQWDEWWLHKSWQMQLFPNIMALSVHCEIRSAF